ncbi:MAG: CbtB domain-containing protein [Rhodospirillales bacterium]
MSRIAASLSAVSVDSGRLWRAGALALAGAALLFVAGFARPDLVHNAAHDARHAFATPCH